MKFSIISSLLLPLIICWGCNDIPEIPFDPGITTDPLKVTSPLATINPGIDYTFLGEDSTFHIILTFNKPVDTTSIILGDDGNFFLLDPNQDFLEPGRLVWDASLMTAEYINDELCWVGNNCETGCTIELRLAEFDSLHILAGTGEALDGDCDQVAWGDYISEYEITYTPTEVLSPAPDTADLSSLTFNFFDSLAFVMEFSRPIDSASVFEIGGIPGSLSVMMSTDGMFFFPMSIGTLSWSNNYKRMTYRVLDTGLSACGNGCTFRVILSGAQRGQVRDENCARIDGDLDGTIGGEFRTVYVVP